MLMIAELTDEQLSVVNRALNGPPDQLLVEGFKLQICRRDIKTLDGLNWLNDEVFSYLTVFLPLTYSSSCCSVVNLTDLHPASLRSTPADTHMSH